MKPNQSIEIQLLNEGGEPLALSNVMIGLSFFTKGNFRYCFGVGRTDNTGRLIVSYNDVDLIRRANAKFDVMDYNTKLDECDSQVEIVIESEEDLRSRHDQVLRSYGAPPSWATSWPSNAHVRAQKKFTELIEPLTLVGIQAR